VEENGYISEKRSIIIITCIYIDMKCVWFVRVLPVAIHCYRVRACILFGAVVVVIVW
jgi:hypothetical protein